MPEQERIIREAIAATAPKLHHTPATCRKYYIHPLLLDSFRSGALFRIMNSAPPRLSKLDGTAALGVDERRVYRLLTPKKTQLPVKGAAL